MKTHVRFDDEGNIRIDDIVLSRARLGALLAFLRTRGWLILLRRDAPTPRPHKEVVITVGRARRVLMSRVGSPPG